VKGEWPTSDSPLTVDLRPQASRASRLPALTPAPARALIELPPTFSEKTMSEHVAWLAAPEREGRGIGTAGLQHAATTSPAQFKTRPDAGRRRRDVVPEGADPEGPGRTAHGGRERHRRHQGDEGRVGRPGRDRLGALRPPRARMARGTRGEHRHAAPRRGRQRERRGRALELARVFASTDKPQRSIVFVAFTGEEAGLVGSRYFVEHPSGVALDKIEGVINLDTVGRLGNGKIAVLGAGTASEWPPTFRGIGFVTASRAPSRPATTRRPINGRSSSAASRRPDVHGPHADYHRPGTRRTRSTRPVS